MQRDDVLSQKKIELVKQPHSSIFSGGDARKLLNLFELVVDTLSSKTETAPIRITDETVMSIA